MSSNRKYAVRGIAVAGLVAALLGMTACSVPQFPGNMSLFPSPSSSSSASQQNGTSHIMTDNDKLAYYKASSADGKHTIVSVLFLESNNNKTVDHDALTADLNSMNVDWYQYITVKSTGDRTVKEGAYLYLPSGMSYDQITALNDTLTKAGYTSNLLTPEEYDNFANINSLYVIMTCYMGPASDEQASQ